MGIKTKLYLTYKFLTGGWAIGALYRAADEDLKMKILGDYKGYSGNEDFSTYHMMELMNDGNKGTLRNVFEFRVRFMKGHEFAKSCFKRAFPGYPGILIGEGDIGPGFRIYHYYCACGFEKVGRNFQLFQGVTSGNRGKPGLPVIGDDVMIGANAVLLGHIHIGDRVKIGAGAVVTFDVPDDCTVVGNPGQIIYPKEKKASAGQV